MYIDFTKNIKEMKEKDVLHKPFPTGSGYALFAKNENDNFVKVLFSSQDHLKKYLADLGYEWGDEGKDEFTNFDCELRLLKVLPELSEVETMAADPQWEISEKAVDLPQNSSVRKMEDLAPELQEELREVDHPLHWDESNYDTKAKKPDFLKKKDDKKKGKDGDKEEKGKNGKKLPPWLNKKKGDKKKGKDGDKEEKDKKLPPWLNKKKSKSKDYSELYKKVSGNEKTPWLSGFEVGDKVRNVNEQCEHYRSEGTVKEIKELPDKAGNLVGYACSNAGHNWGEGDLLFKTPDQLEKLDQAGAPCGPGGCFY